MAGDEGIEVPAELLLEKYARRLSASEHRGLMLEAHVEQLGATLARYQQAFGPLPTPAPAAGEPVAQVPEVVDAEPGR